MDFVKSYLGKNEPLTIWTLLSPVFFQISTDLEKKRAFSKYMNLPKAELVEVLRCSAFTSVMRSKIPAKIMVYKTPTNEIHKTIHVGTKMISQGQLIILEKNNSYSIQWCLGIWALIQKRGKCCWVCKVCKENQYFANEIKYILLNIAMEILMFWSNFI